MNDFDDTDSFFADLRAVLSVNKKITLDTNSPYIQNMNRRRLNNMIKNNATRFSSYDRIKNTSGVIKLKQKKLDKLEPLYKQLSDNENALRKEFEAANKARAGMEEQLHAIKESMSKETKRLSNEAYHKYISNKEKTIEFLKGDANG